MRSRFGWYEFLYSGTNNYSPMPCCKSPLVPLVSAVIVLLVLQSHLSFMDRVYDDHTFLQAHASTTE